MGLVLDHICQPVHRALHSCRSVWSLVLQCERVRSPSSGLCHPTCTETFIDHILRVHLPRCSHHLCGRCLECHSQTSRARFKERRCCLCCLCDQVSARVSRRHHPVHQSIRLHYLLHLRGHVLRRRAPHHGHSEAEWV